MNTQKTVKTAILFLAGRCNHASTWDGAGFGKFDAGYGHWLADLMSRGEVPNEKNWAGAQRLCHKYRKQLAAAGFDAEALAAEPMPAQPAKKADDGKEPVDLGVCAVLKTTEKAVRLAPLTNHNGSGFGAFWMPKSLASLSPVVGGDLPAGSVYVQVPRWFARKNDEGTLLNLAKLVAAAEQAGA